MGHAQPTALTPAPTTRDSLARAIEDAIAALDAYDGDENLEDDGNAEPSLGSLEHLGRHAQERWATGATDDREEVCEDEGAQCDDEGMSGIWDPDREPDADAEPDQYHVCNWQDEGDQTILRRLAVYSKPPTGLRPSWANVAGCIPVRVL